MNDVITNSDDVVLWTVAEKAFSRYAQGILTSESLREQMMREWEEQYVGEVYPSYNVLTRIAQRICSRALYAAWHSSNSDLYDCAFSNLRRYLECSLRKLSSCASLQDQANVIEDVVHQVLETLHYLMRNGHSGLKDPAAFLQWTQVIARRQMRVFLQKSRRDMGLSLEVQMQHCSEQFVDDSDPLNYVLSREIREVLCNAILAMKNKHYQQVLIYTYMGGVDEGELAQCLDVEVQKIYLWRHRALKALRNQLGVEKSLRSLL